MKRARRYVIIALGVIALILVVPLFLGCQTGVSQGLPIHCAPGWGDDTYNVSGKHFTVGRLATWRQSIFIEPYNVVTMQIDGTVDLYNAIRPNTLQVNDLTLIRGGGTLHAGGDFTNRPLIDGPIFGSGTLAFDGSVRLEGRDVNGFLVSLLFPGSRLLVNGGVTVNATGSNVTGLYSADSLEIRHSGDRGNPTIFVQGSERAVGVSVGVRHEDSEFRLSNAYVRVEGPESVGVAGRNAWMLVNASQIEAPDGVGVDMRQDSNLYINAFSSIAGGAAAIRGDEGAQFASLSGRITGNIDLGDGADTLELDQDEFLALEDGDVTLGAGDDVLNLHYTLGAIDAVLDGGDDNDTLIVDLDFSPNMENAPTEADIAAADGELELPAFTLRWTNFEEVRIGYFTEEDEDAPAEDESIAPTEEAES